GRHRTAGALLPGARALRPPRLGPVAAPARAARRRAGGRRPGRAAPARARARVDRRPRLGPLRRGPVARAGPRLRGALGRRGDGRPGRRALLHAARVPAQALRPAVDRPGGRHGDRPGRRGL
ncbi:MAG: hypothetical protein AVDCRST_MAG13-2320, partial [uncultured Solirubrobacteraceae bacterium]